MERIILIGLSGTGKSQAGRLVARKLGFDFVDTDRDIVSRFDMPVADIFARFGEPVFRAVEREVVAQSCKRLRVVVATGGGVPADEANWVAMRPQSLIVQLTAEPSEIVSRLRAQLAECPGERRPLLEAGDPEALLRRQLQERGAAYEQADLKVGTTGKTPDEVASIIEDAWLAASREALLPVASIGVPSGRSDLYVASGLTDHLGALARRRWPEARRAWVVSDEHVLPLWGDAAGRSLRAGDFDVNAFAVTAGEGSKSLAGFAQVLDWLIGGGIDRRDVVVALGGGVVGDLAGFAAAAVLRGVGLVQVPTSLLAMVDSSVGGKTGINHAHGKNLIGAFYQPQLILADTALLETLPPRQFAAGMAEVIKHAMIERSATGRDEANLLRRLEALPVSLDASEMAELVRRNVLIKAAVVRQDEREGSLRRILNYGHTLGHAMEAAGYRYLHGEAVALGMRAAARLALGLGATSTEIVDRQDALLDRFHLPARFKGELEVVMERLTRDKKAVHGTLTWILPTKEVGLVEIRHGVPIEQVERVGLALGATTGAFDRRKGPVL